MEKELLCCTSSSKYSIEIAKYNGKVLSMLVSKIEVSVNHFDHGKSLNGTYFFLCALLYNKQIIPYQNELCFIGSSIP